MINDESINPMEVFMDETKDDNLQIQIESIQKLPMLAVSLGEDRVRTELMPYLFSFIETNYTHDEILLNISEQLENFTPLVGGFEHVNEVLKVLEKLCSIDETIVREKAVKSLENIAATLNEEQIESNFIPLIIRTGRQEWFTTKCSATGLFAVCYPKVSEELKTELRLLFTSLMQDDSPMVRRSAVNKFTEFSKVLELEHIKSDFIPVLDNLITDAQDSVRILAVGVAISIANKLEDTNEIEELVWKNIRSLGDDASWRVRCQVATDIHEIQKSTGKDFNRENLIILYQNLVRDGENQVREAAAKNIVYFCTNLVETYGSNDQADFENAFQQEIMPLIKELYTDSSDEVRIALSSVLMLLSTVISISSVKNELLPIIKAAIEQEESAKVKENIIKNLDLLIDVVGLNDIISSVHLLIDDLVNKSESQWRTRRSVLVTFVHLAKHSGKQYFNEHLKGVYFKLLSDPVFAVRKTAPLIFPILVKYFGISWALKSLLPQVLCFLNHVNYLYRFVALFGIEEFVKPSLMDETNSDTIKYLRNLEKLCNDEDAAVQQNAMYVLVKLVKLQALLKHEFEQSWIQESFENFDRYEYFNDDIRSYAEDTLENFCKDCDFDVFDVTKQELISQEHENSYLEGVLIFCIKYFLGAIKQLLNDPVPNVQVRAKRTLVKIEQFCQDFQTELDQDWVQSVLKRIAVDDIVKIEEKLKEELLQSIIPEQSKRDYVRESVIPEEKDEEMKEEQIDKEDNLEEIKLYQNNSETEKENDEQVKKQDKLENVEQNIETTQEQSNKENEETKTLESEIIQTLDEKLACYDLQ